MADYKILLGNCKETLKTLEDESVDSIVTDPPYELGFMNKKWDSQGIAYDVEMWQECLRVLKPGGYLLAFGGTRTYHRMTCAIEDAGFEIRDSIDWLYGCLDEETECLTASGWKRYTDLSTSDKVMQWDSETGELSWTNPSEVLVYPYSGKMVRLVNRHTDQMLTPNHRVYAKIRRHSRNPAPTAYEVEEAGQLKNHWQIDLPMAGQLGGSVQVTPERAYLVGWWLTDAWKHGDGKAVMFSQSKPEMLAKLRKSLTPHKPSEYVKEGRKDNHRDEHTFYVTGELAEYLLANHPDRRLTWDMLQWSFEARRALFEGLMDGDGSCPDHQRAWAFWSKDQDRRDVFLALALSIGHRAYDDPDNNCVHVNIGKDSTQIQYKHRVEDVDYEGDVWCVRVPAGAFVVRRNGRPFITGNSGFPKSVNISKEINKRSGVEFKAIPASGVGFMNADKEDGYNTTKNQLIQVGETTDEAKRWEGWGTALKPAREPIVVARKPFEGPLYKNVLEHGTGGMNIDACRVDPKGAALRSEAYPSGRWPANIVITHSVNCINIGEGQTKARVINRWTDGAKPFGGGAGHEFTTHQTSEDGNERYDIYECVEGCPAKLLDEQSGIAKPKAARRGRIGGRVFFGRFDHASLEGVWPSDPGGGASRFFNQLNWSEEDFLPFFYTAKASNKERNAGLDHLETRSAGEVTGGRKEGSAGLNNPRAGAGRTSGNKNFHPTVKPVKLMEWLVRLVTPPGGTVLDPFMGSGTTGVAAINQGFNFIGCELMEEYIPIAEGRIEHALNARK